MEVSMFVPSPALMRPIVIAPQLRSLPLPPEIPYASSLEIGHWALIALLTLVIFSVVYLYLAIDERNYRGTPLFSFGRHTFGSWWAACSAATLGFPVLVIIVTEVHLKGFF